MPFLLIVEDDANSAEMLAELGKADGYDCAIATDLADARQQMLIHEPDIVLLDLHLPDGYGLELFADKSLRRNAEIILMTGNASIESSVKALRLGAADYLIKPINAAMLSRVLARTLQTAAIPARPGKSDGRGKTSGNPELASASQHPDQMVGSSTAMSRVYKQIEKVARTSVSVFVVGESGTGKELVAQAVHAQSRRTRANFKAVNCGAISQQLIESELFGHEKGSFTGAIKQHKGIFEQADGGSLFLDEITEMPLDLQVRLLRVLETGTFSRVGSGTLLFTDVRIIAATNRDPIIAVQEGKLREDLYYRLNVFQIKVPALRERPDDISVLAQHFLDGLGVQEKRDYRLGRQALTSLRAYQWPGNVRELKNAMQRAAILADGELIESVDIPQTLTSSHSVKVPIAAQSGDKAVAINVGMTIAEAERELILATLNHNQNAKEATARSLGISMKTLYNRLRTYDIDR